MADETKRGDVSLGALIDVTAEMKKLTECKDVPHAVMLIDHLNRTYKHAYFKLVLSTRTVHQSQTVDLGNLSASVGSLRHQEFLPYQALCNGISTIYRIVDPL